MERELWPPLYGHVQAAAKMVAQKYIRYQPDVIVAVYLWAAINDRHPAWACREENWVGLCDQPRRLPSPSTLSRRLRRVGIGVFVRFVAERLRQSGDPALVAFVDGKSLLIGGHSRDPDARFGKAAGHFGNGYKLQAIGSEGPLPDAWDVTPLNGCERTTTHTLLPQLSSCPGGYLLGDGLYDASTLYDAVARTGRQLLAPCRKAKNPGRGKHYQSPHRRAGLAILKTASGQRLFRQRTRIERCFGHLTGFAGGLGPLPAWIRRLRRVRFWVWAKLLINAVRIHLTQ